MKAKAIKYLALITIITAVCIMAAASFISSGSTPDTKNAVFVSIWQTGQESKL